MLSIQSVTIIGLLYISLLFVIAYLGDRHKQQIIKYDKNNLIYSLSLAVYCSSWTFYGAVGTAAVTGLDYLAIYLGPCLVFLFGYPMIRKIILISKQNNITSVSDFISSRFGKSRGIAILVTVIAVIGSIPYIALQLKAVTMSFGVLTSHYDGPSSIALEVLSAGDAALYIGIILAIFAIFFGTRHLDATEHHQGLILAISFESIVKLLAILAVGYYSIYLLVDGNFQSPMSSGYEGSILDAVTGNNTTWQSFATKLLLSMGAIFLLPRQFHVMIVEARHHGQFRTAMWVMPIYLILTSIIVVPIALSGTLLLPEGKADLYMLTLPLMMGNEPLALLAFIGGLSAATGMVVVAAISLSTMVSNDLVMPYLLSIKRLNVINHPKLNNIILLIRRIAIVVLIAAAYGYYALIDTNVRLANIGLISFAAIIQFLPAVISALYWKRANSKGAFYGLIGGFSVWAYCLLFPTVLPEATFNHLLGSQAFLHPEKLFGMTLTNSLTHGVFWSLLINTALLIIYSFRYEQNALEKIQAVRFLNVNDQIGNVGTSGNEQILVRLDAVRILAENIIGAKSTDALLDQYEKRYHVTLDFTAQIDPKLLSSFQRAMAGVIGGSLAQRVVSETLLVKPEYLEEVTSFVDETSMVLKFNRNLLQTTLENISQGISVVDKDLNLVVWNDRYTELFGYPERFLYVGKPIREVLEFNAQRGDLGFKNPMAEVKKRLRHLQKQTAYEHIRYRTSGSVVKYIGVPMPGGGFVTTYEDITKSVKASQMLKTANEELEDRVHERTKELEVLTEELEKTTRSKTHFLAAASHDLLQPINAARLFAHNIIDNRDNPKQLERLVNNIDQSLLTANQLLRALLDVSKLDTGGITPKLAVFSINELFNELENEFEGMVDEKDIVLQMMYCTAVIEADRRLLFSVVQNFIANAVRYTAEGGKVLVGVRRRANHTLELQVLDTGEGIKQDEQELIFNEFYRVSDGSTMKSDGLGLGLSIAKRIADLLDLPINMQSVFGKGSMFSITIPMSHTEYVEPEKIPSNRLLSRVDDIVDKRILCLDNEPKVLEAMQGVLDSWGCEVLYCYDFEAAKSAIENQTWDVILADYRLNGIATGLDLLEVAKQTNDQCIRVLITAEQDEKLKKKVLDSGHSFLEKPIEPNNLRILISTLLVQRKSQK